MVTNSFAYEPPRYKLLPKSYKPLKVETYLFRFVLWLVGLIVDWKDGLRKPTLGKLVFYFALRYLLSLADHLIESFFDWLIVDQRSPKWQTH